MGPTASLMITSLLAVAGLMTLVWLLSLAKKDVSIIDAFWGPAFVLIAALGYFRGPGFEGRRELLLILVGLWGLRLGAYLLWRNLREGQEDYRYRKMRERWGSSFAFGSLLRVFLFQAVLAWFISIPLQVAAVAGTPARLVWLDWVGVGLWAVGFFFEAVGDYQLARFKADPGNQGEVLDSGLWRYTRHPNYFGDFLVWWGLFAISVATPWGWATVASPLFMSYLLMKFSGVPLLEKKLRKTRPKYRDYVARTSAFFPRPPNSG